MILIYFYTEGVVPESKSKVEEDRKMLGQGLNHGRVWLIWCDGETFVTCTRNNNKRFGKRRECCSMAIRYES